MKKLIMFIALTVILFGPSKNTYAQTNNEVNYYFEMTKIKDLNGDAGNMYMEYMKPYLEAKVKEGKIQAHFFFRTLSSANPDTYDYVGVEIYDSFAQIYSPWSETMQRAQKVFEGQDISKIGQRMDKASATVSSVIYQSMMEAFPGPEGGNGENFKFVALYYLDVEEDMTQDFMKTFGTYMMPVVQKGASEGLINDLTLARKALPVGTKTGPGFMEIRTFSKWENIEKFNPFELMQKVHPNVNFEEMGAKFDGKVEMTHSEVYELIGVVTPETIKAAGKTEE